MNGSTETIDNIKQIGKEQFEILYKISQALNSATYQDGLIKETLDVIIRVLHARQGTVCKI